MASATQTRQIIRTELQDQLPGVGGGGGGGSGGGPTVSTGDTYFVHSGTGSSTGGGRNPEDALTTIDAAFNKCSASVGDRVFVMEGHSEALSSSVTMDTAGVSIIGLGVGTARPSLTVSGTTDGITITAANCVVDNLLFNEAGATGDVNINVNAADCIIRNCHFDFATSEDCITIEAAGDRLRITGCKFQVTGGGPDACILPEAAGVDDLEIDHNYFILSNAGSDAIDVGAIECAGLAVTGLLVHHDIFSGDGVASAVLQETALLNHALINNSYIADAIDADIPANTVENDVVAMRNVLGGLGAGKVWYVDSVNGDASYDGLSPRRALVTLDAANNLATAGDTIIAMEAHAETISDATSWVPDTAGIRYIGQGRGARRPTITFDNAAGTIPISGAGVELHNFLFELSGTIDAVDGILVSAADVLLKDIEMREVDADTQFVDAIVGTTCDRLEITNFKFLGFAGSDEACQAAISVTGTPVGLKITNSWISGTFGAAGIDISGIAVDMLIRDSHIEQHHGTVDACITVAGTATGFLVNSYLRTATDDDAGITAALTATNDLQIYNIQVVNSNGQFAVIGASEVTTLDTANQMWGVPSVIT